MKDDLGGKILAQYSCLIDDGSEDQKGKGTKKCAMKQNLKCEDYKNCLEATQLEDKINI